MRKTLPVLLTLTALLGTPNAASCQSLSSSASHSVTITISAIRRLDVNAEDDITGVGNLSKGVSFPESKIDVFRNGSRIPLEGKILQQYHDFLDHPELAGIDWNTPGWHYYSVNQQVLKNLQKSSQFTTTNKTLENGILYYTVTPR